VIVLGPFELREKHFRGKMYRVGQLKWGKCNVLIFRWFVISIGENFPMAFEAGQQTKKELQGAAAGMMGR